jgi:putative aldouronate transport system permease protein
MKKSVGGVVFDSFNIIIFTLFAASCAFPLINIFAKSIANASEYTLNALMLFPKNPQFVNYIFIFSSTWIFNGVFVQVQMVILGTLWTLFLNGTVAYGLNNDQLPGRKFFTFFFIVPAYISGGMIPLYLIITQYLKLSNTVVAYSMCIGVSMFTFIVLRTFLRSGIPKSLIESARIDGAGEYTILFKICLPLSKPVFATMGMFAAVQFWNSWFTALIYSSNDKNYPLTLIVRNLVIALTGGGEPGGGAGARLEEIRKQMAQQYGLEQNGLFLQGMASALIVFSIVPIMLVYPFIQKYFSKGVVVGAVKF